MLYKRKLAYKLESCAMEPLNGESSRCRMNRTSLRRFCFSVWKLDSSSCGSLFLAFPLFPDSGKGKKMKTPKTPAAFDYDLWTTENGKYMVRIKATGEVAEVERTVI